MECNFFDRWYNCTLICESCMSQNRKHKNSDPAMWYDDFRDSSPRHLTTVDDQTYRRTCKTISPYSCIPGWTLGTTLRDIMHIVYLGTAQDLIPSLLADWISHDILGEPGQSVNERLRAFSLEMHQVFKQEQTPGLNGECFFSKLFIWMSFLVNSYNP